MCFPSHSVAGAMSALIGREDVCMERNGLVGLVPEATQEHRYPFGEGNGASERMH